MINSVSFIKNQYINKPINPVKIDKYSNLSFCSKDSFEKSKSNKVSANNTKLNITDNNHNKIKEYFKSQYRNNISSKEIESLEYYLLTGYHFINEYLRNNNVTDNLAQDMRIARKNLDNVIKKARTPKDIVVYRGLEHKYDFQAGKVYMDKGFISTSYSKKVAENIASRPFEKAQGNLFILKIPKGTECLDVDAFLEEADKVFKDQYYMTSFGYEQELILPRNSKFKILSHDREAGIVEAEIVKARNLDFVEGKVKRID